MGRGKSWDAHENGALAAAWVAAWRAAGPDAETGTRAFVRAMHERFAATAPPHGASAGRYAARSEQACKQHFADLAADVRRAGACKPPPDSPIALAWAELRAVPRFREPPPKPDDDASDQDDDDFPVPSGAPAAMPARADPARRARKRARIEERSPSQPLRVSELAATANSALRDVASAVRALVDTHGERNAIMAFSDRAFADSEQARRERNEYFTILRRVYLHKARLKERELALAQPVIPSPPAVVPPPPPPPSRMRPVPAPPMRPPPLLAHTPPQSSPPPQLGGSTRSPTGSNGDAVSLAGP